MAASESTNPRFIARQLALGFGSVSLVAVGMCALLVAVIDDVAGLVESMRHDESSIQQGMELATAVREMSIHVGNSLIAGDGSQLGQYNHWRGQARARIQTLAARIPAAQRSRLEALGATTQSMHELFTGTALPARQRGEAELVQKTHRQLVRLGKQAAGQADILAAATTQQMAHAHDHATSSTRTGLLGGGLCALLIVALSVAFTHRLRSVVLQPLELLTDAALRYGRGDFAFRLRLVGRGELAAVGEAFSRMADELARREARLLHNERMAVIGQFAAGIAHELNNPIGIIRGYLKTMNPEQEPETLCEELSILDEEAAHCQRIADDLLTYARAAPLSYGPVAMEEFLRETATRYAVGVDEMDVEVAAEPAVVEADGTRLRQVLLNLLNNAGQMSPPGSTLTLCGTQNGDWYRIEVTDQGPGIGLSDRERVFEPFFSKRRGGSGLGLAVCEGIVKAHGGSIQVQAAQGGGAVFRVELPRKQPEGERAPIVPSTVESGS